MAKKQNSIFSWVEQYRPLIILFIGIILALIAPGIASQYYLNFVGWSFHDTGEIGDTIGGIAGPILNLTGLVLVYYSFREQYKANQLQIESNKKLRKDVKRQLKRADKERNFELFLKLLNQLKQAINDGVNYDQINERIEDKLLHFMGNFGQDISEYCGRQRYENEPKIREKYPVNLEEYRNAMDEMEKESHQKAFDLEAPKETERFMGVFISSEAGSKLYYIFNKVEQIINRIKTLDLFEEERTYLKDDLTFSLQNLMKGNRSEDK